VRLVPSASGAARRFPALAAFSGIFVAALLGALVIAPARPARGDDQTGKQLWTLEFEPGMPRRVTIGTEPNLEVFWYLPFKLKNPDQQDHSFFLEITGVSDKNYQYRSMTQPQVKEKIRRRLGLHKEDTLWTEEDFTVAHEPTDVNAAFPRKLDLPVIKAGETVQCAAIFHGWDNEMDFLTVSVKGLTNDVIETKTAPHERKLSERVFQLHYERRGQDYMRTEQPVEYVGHEWVTVDRIIKTDLE
jgi:hypothetical protein